MEIDVNSPVDLNGLKLESRVMVGAGPVKSFEDVRRVAKSASAAVVLGSITVAERMGNLGSTYFVQKDGRFSHNSKGLPNPGIAYYGQNLAEMTGVAHAFGKPLIVSVAGFSPDEYAHISEVIAGSGVDGQELNLGCPNVWGLDGKQKRIASFDLEVLEDILRKQEEAIGFDFWTAVKLSPFSDPVLLEEVAGVICSSRLVRAVVTSNTFPNGFYFNEQGEPTITSGGGLAGIGGEAMRPIALGQVRQLRQVLPDCIPVIGVSGISQRSHVKDYLKVGAAATQVTTAFINEGESFFSKLRDYQLFAQPL